MASGCNGVECCLRRSITFNVAQGEKKGAQPKWYICIAGAGSARLLLAQLKELLVLWIPFISLHYPLINKTHHFKVLYTQQEQPSYTISTSIHIIRNDSLANQWNGTRSETYAARNARYALQDHVIGQSSYPSNNNSASKNKQLRCQQRVINFNLAAIVATICPLELQPIRRQQLATKHHSFQHD